MLDGVLLACIWCCCPHKPHSVKGFLSFGCQLFLYLGRKVTDCFYEIRLLSHVCWISLSSHARAARAGDCLQTSVPMLSWRDEQSPGDASGPAGTSERVGHYGGISRTWNQAPDLLSFTCWYLLLSATGCNMWGSIWFSSNSQQKHFPRRLVVVRIRNASSSLGPGSCPTLFCLPRPHGTQVEKLEPLTHITGK